MKKTDSVKNLLLLMILVLVLTGIIFYSNMMHLACVVSLVLALITGSIFTHYLNAQYLNSLERQENLRKQMTADVAHELRTPLTAVSTHLEMMIDGVWQPSPERLQICYDEIEKLGKMVSDLERLAKLEGKALTLEKSPQDLLALVTAEAKGFSADIAVTGENTVVSVDRTRIGQVVSNLISNAIKYGKGDLKIRITVQNSPKCGKIIVEDNGSGIAKSDLPFIFERFYRAEKSRNRSTGGTGLGLTISKNIVESHGGHITVESRLGQGSRFTVVLPK